MWNIQKIDEFLNSLPPNAPQVISLREHHLRAEENKKYKFKSIYFRSYLLQTNI